MELAAEFYWVVPAAVFVATAFAVYHGYTTKNQRESSTVFNSAVVDSAVGHALVKEVRRLANAAEAIEERLEKAAHAEDIRAAIAAELEKREGPKPRS
jgi:3-phosphoglycerate kinase